MPKVRVYLACSLDGYIAGPDNDLSWLAPSDPPPSGPTEALKFADFMTQVGVMLGGGVALFADAQRRNFEIVYQARYHSMAQMTLRPAEPTV